MENITVGSQFTTQKSGVSGTVQEIVKNANGTSRIRLSLANGDNRWTTVKQSNLVGEWSYPTFFHSLTATSMSVVPVIVMQ